VIERAAPQAGAARGRRLKRDDFSSNRPHASAHCPSLIFSENRDALFGIML
jgi:hypothetical protein